MMRWTDRAKYFCPICNGYWNESGVMHCHYNVMIKKEESKMKITDKTDDWDWKNANKNADGYLQFKESKMNSPSIAGISKMTREEAIRRANKCVFKANTDERDINMTKNIIGALEALGLLKFEEEKKPEVQLILEYDGNKSTGGNVNFDDLKNTYGTIRLEEWPEGLVLWVGGGIKWKSWEKYYKHDDLVYGYHHATNHTYQVKII